VTCAKTKFRAVPRADHHATGGRGIGLDIGAGKRLTVMSAAIFERMSYAIQLDDSDVETIDLGIESPARGEG